MRNTAEAERSPAAARRAGAARRSRTPAASEPTASVPPEAAASEAPSLAVTAVRMVPVDEGLYALRIGEIDGSPGEVGGMLVPAAHVAAPFAEDGNGVEIVAGFPRRGPWVGKSGGTMILRSPAAGKYVVVTLYGVPGQAAAELPLDLRRLDGPAVESERAGTAVAAAGGPRAAGLTGLRDLPTEIMLHIERTGDRLFPGRGWVGALGRRMRIEGFSIKPLEQLAPGDIELKGYLPNGGETPWVPGDALCGTRGRGLPLIGFAVRIAPQHAERFDVFYQGSFFNSGISEQHRNGSPCRAASDDPLEAISVRVVERVPEPETPETAV
jgi:hypothetical protein